MRGVRSQGRSSRLSWTAENIYWVVCVIKWGDGFSQERKLWNDSHDICVEDICVEATVPTQYLSHTPCRDNGLTL